MRKTALILMILWTVAPALAGESLSSGFYAGIGTGADLPGSQWDADYYVGGGAQILTGYQLDPDWSGQVDLEEWIFTGAGNSLYNFRVTGQVKYAFDSRGWQPYLLAGAGTVFQALSPSGDSTTNFDALGGLGVQFDLAPRTHWYLQAEANFILSQSTSFLDVPITSGLWVGL